MLIMKSGKRQLTEGIEISKNNQNTQRKGNLQLHGNTGSGHHQISRDERKI